LGASVVAIGKNPRDYRLIRGRKKETVGKDDERNNEKSLPLEEKTGKKRQNKKSVSGEPDYPPCTKGAQASQLYRKSTAQ